MISLNKTSHLGNLTRDPELRHTARGTAVAQIGLAVNKSTPDGNGGFTETPIFLDITIWGKTAENTARFCRKGSKIYIDGRLEVDQWEDKNTGAKRSRMKIIAEKVIFLSHPKRPAAADPQEPRKPSHLAPTAPEPLNEDLCDDEDIPF